ncbi:hypothetical protein [Pseudoclavibacter sp. CFCC 13611]|uniref:hypothetical protein n=1 Tax=Pseudoclavibacter sp. CFCC 13611 TaxID=2615178 RepID=UPI0013014637|nr:hypothetical protein [Pseudoclavibacter sp. CFCC 13611]KAB1662823.1 hypothetical protein F8O08_09670 [Pseudoclavibacter sp. CFCC 13611]
MAAPTADQVAAFLGEPDDQRLKAAAAVHLPIVAELIREYTRGRGFTRNQATQLDEPTDGIAAVIVSATARLTQNPQGIITQSVNGASIRQTVFEGLSLFEQTVLNNYRRRAS